MISDTWEGGIWTILEGRTVSTDFMGNVQPYLALTNLLIILLIKVFELQLMTDPFSTVKIQHFI